MSDGETLTRSLLARLHGGDAAALRELLARDLPWIEAQVRRRLGAALRARAETMDFVQEAVVQALKHGPRFVVSDQEQFRALMVRIVENAVRKQHRFHGQQRRDAARQAPLPSQSIVDLDGSRGSPSVVAARAEHRALVQLALELLDADDRDIVLLRHWDGLPFAEVGVRLGLSEDAARMRFQRALKRLALLVKRIHEGGVGAALVR
jgi:RNA polymerase sigma-70 factor (ECF subfamily)